MQAGRILLRFKSKSHGQKKAKPNESLPAPTTKY